MPGPGLSLFIISFYSYLLYVSSLYWEKNKAREVKQLDECHTARTRMAQILSEPWTRDIMQPLILFPSLLIPRQVRFSLFSEGHHQSWLQVVVLLPQSAWVSPWVQTLPKYAPQSLFTIIAGLSLSSSGSGPISEKPLECTPCFYFSFYWDPCSGT